MEVENSILYVSTVKENIFTVQKNPGCTIKYIFTQSAGIYSTYLK